MWLIVLCLLLKLLFNKMTCFNCVKMKLISDHKDYRKTLNEFSQEELEYFTLDYLIKNAKPVELLNCWHKLPTKYVQNFKLSTKLPCFIHYNRPEWSTHVDGPPTSQDRCHLCKL